MCCPGAFGDIENVDTIRASHICNLQIEASNLDFAGRGEISYVQVPSISNDRGEQQKDESTSKEELFFPFRTCICI